MLVHPCSACLKNVPLSADLALVDCVSGNTTWTQHGAVLADVWNTRIDNTDARGYAVILGPDIP